MFVEMSGFMIKWTCGFQWPKKKNDFL